MNTPQAQESKPVQPFFVRFLEQQQALAVQTDVKAGRPNYTLKYPSDSDEAPTT
ncbi:MAG: microviridin/marinostatin family tricyclic proteinase inhibitor [Planctomycetes bacterium]|nr:microviridin/marinostatin family tricyclic proteinase inhibitor [Planctomycetota bacterium]